MLPRCLLSVIVYNNLTSPLITIRFDDKEPGFDDKHRNLCSYNGEA